jgi:enamine deaminase RidA (YjgF/YER057c/UK114 family)
VLPARPDLYREMNEAYAEFFPGPKPARAMVSCAENASSKPESHPLTATPELPEGSALNGGVPAYGSHTEVLFSTLALLEGAACRVFRARAALASIWCRPFCSGRIR